MKQLLKIGICTLWLLAVSYSASGQYYNEGQDPFSTRWSQLKTDRYRLLFPEQNREDARRVNLVLDTSYHALHYGFSRQAKPLPVILHTQNLHSNGVVTWTPKRSELIVAPPTETHATPWLKQLSVHEYRHVVQMSNLDRNVFKAFSWVLGEQSLGMASIFVPKWFLEGDAVLAETNMATYGRALQPEFTIAYRAYLAEEDVRQFHLDKWFCGSFNDYIPNHYNLGYQLANASYKKYGPDFWDEIFEYVTRRPYQVIPRLIAFRKLYDTSSGELFRETFREMKAYWDSLPEVEETMDILPTEHKSYTVYSYPVVAGANLILAHKYDFTKPDRIVAVNPHTSKEKVVAYTGNLSSRLTLIGNDLWWTEYKPSTFWEQKNSSVVRKMALDTSKKTTTFAYPGNLFYVTAYTEGRVAAIEYDPVGKYSLVLFDSGFRPVQTLRIPDEWSVHGMAWDEKTATLALLTLTEEGMALTGADPESEAFYPITKPSFVTINHLTAGDGKLFFNSIRSGRDESHYYDLVAKKEYRVSASTFGTVMPSVDETGQTLVQTSYRKEGYLLSTQKLSETKKEELAYAELPVNLVNPEMYDFGLPNLDTMELFTTTPETAERIKPKRYRKGTHLLDFHSWAPISFDVFETSNERNLDFKVGATVMSQNSLSNTEAYASYGHVNSHNWWRGGVRLLAFAPKFEVNVEYDGGNRGVVRPNREIPIPLNLPDKKYFMLEGRMYLPINLSGGGRLRSLIPSVSVKHQNTAFYRPEKEDFTSGYEKAEFELAYSQTSRMAYRDLAPRWGFGVRGLWTTGLFDKNFGSLWSLYGNVYLPGVMDNHSLRVRGVVQGQKQKYYHFGTNVLFPRGCDYNFAPKDLWAMAGEYRFPVAYPDWGIDQFIYLKRISLNLFGGYSRYTPVSNLPIEKQKAYSYGGEVSFDFNPLRMSGTNVNLRVALYNPSDKSGLGTMVGVSFDL